MKVCAALTAIGHDLRLWLPGRDPKLDWAELASHYGLAQRFSISWMRSIGALRRYDYSLRALIAGWRWGADLFYVWPYQAAAIASRWGLPTLMEVHDRPAGRMGPPLFRMFLAGSGARRMLVTTEALRRFLADRYARPLAGPFAQVAPNGVDLERYEGLPSPPEARAALGLPEGFTVGCTGHLYPGRGIELTQELARRMHDVRFLWAGGEPETVERWRARLANEGIDNLQILGFVPNQRLPMVQAACDALLLPYRRQIAASSGGDIAETTSPMKLFEYLAAERAILASDLPILRELLNAENAVLLPPEDPEAWELAIHRIRKYPDRRSRLAERARQEAQAHSWISRARQAVEGLEPGDDRPTDQPLNGD